VSVLHSSPWLGEAWQQLSAREASPAHALLIHGAEGIGKLALGRAWAQRILCEATPGAFACGQCEGCHWFLGGQHPDYRQIQPEALAGVEVDSELPASASKTTKPSLEIKVDQVRALSVFLNTQSHRGRRRVVVVHPAEAMNTNAANSLLKSLEEPPSGACFILISNHRDQLIPTIRSRCVDIAAVSPSWSTALDWLKKERVDDPEVWLGLAGGAPLLARDRAEHADAKRVLQLVTALRSCDRAALEAWNPTDRGELELFTELLQKYAHDQVRLLGGGTSVFFPELMIKNNPALPNDRPTDDQARPAGAGSLVSWLSYARHVGKQRSLASHPLNPRLFALDLLSGLPQA